MNQDKFRIKGGVVTLFNPTVEGIKIAAHTFNLASGGLDPEIRIAGYFPTLAIKGATGGSFTVSETSPCLVTKVGTRWVKVVQDQIVNGAKLDVDISKGERVTIMMTRPRFTWTYNGQPFTSEVVAVCPKCQAQAVIKLPDPILAEQPDDTTHVCHPARGGCNHGFALDKEGVS